MSSVCTSPQGASAEHVLSPPIPSLSPPPPHLPPLPHRCPHNCLSRPHTLEATSPAPRRRRCHTCDRMDSPAAGDAHLRPPMSHRCSFGSPNSGATVLRDRLTWEPGVCTPRRISQRSNAGTLSIFCGLRYMEIAKALSYPQRCLPSSLSHASRASAWSQRCTYDTNGP